MDGETHPSNRLIEQRIRNRIIEYLELASSFEAQHAYQRDTIAFVPAEMIDQWEDWNPVDQSRWPGRLAEPYSSDEIEAMHTFHAEWLWVVEHTPRPLPDLAAVQDDPAWDRLRQAAAAALSAFESRGRLPEDREV